MFTAFSSFLKGENLTTGRRIFYNLKELSTIWKEYFLQVKDNELHKKGKILPENKNKRRIPYKQIWKKENSLQKGEFLTGKYGKKRISYKKENFLQKKEWIAYTGKKIFFAKKQVKFG